MGESSLLYHFAFAAVRSNLHVSACFMRVFLIELMNADSMTKISLYDVKYKVECKYLFGQNWVSVVVVPHTNCNAIGMNRCVSRDDS